MSTIAVLGAGEIGGATARALASGGHASRILLIDPSSPVARGKALDIAQSGAIEPFDARPEGTHDVSRVTGCAVCVVADRATAGSAEWSGEDALALLGQVVPLLSDAPLVFAGALQSDLLARVARDHGIQRSRLIGSAPEALVSAARAMVAMEAGCSPKEVSLALVGVPPDGFVFAWSEATIGGYALQRTLQQVQVARVERRVRGLWPPGPYALGAAAAAVASAIVSSSRVARSILTVLDGEFGERHLAGIVPALFSAHGVLSVRAPSLSTREQVMLDTALRR